MRNAAILLAMLLAGCPGAPTQTVNTAAPAPVKSPVLESKVVMLYYSTATQKESEEARLNAFLADGWRVVSTDTQSGAGVVGGVTIPEWTVTVTLEREKP